jgi:hypothetical protein
MEEQLRIMVPQSRYILQGKRYSQMGRDRNFRGTKSYNLPYIYLNYDLKLI